MSEALRLYYPAKWLAERNHATAAEWRYREASRLALQTRRKVLAAHALGRFGCPDGIGWKDIGDGNPEEKWRLESK